MSHAKKRLTNAATCASMAAVACLASVYAEEQKPFGAPTGDCDELVQARIHVDQGHAWRPPFGIDRVGAPPVVHVAATAKQAPDGHYFMVSYREGQPLERIPVSLSKTPSVLPQDDEVPYFAHAQLTSIPDEVALGVSCGAGEMQKELLRQSVDWPQLEAHAAVRADRQINPVDLGAILVPNDWLLLAEEQSALIDVAAVSRDRALPQARLKAWFDGGNPTQAAMALERDRRTTQTLRLPLSVRGASTVLNVALNDGSRDLWTKKIRTMVVAKPLGLPVFGVVQTKLRYDAPISVNDPLTGQALSPLDYKTAWKPELKDVVVALPNGSRFVFWRGASYAPFWAGLYNTGLSYQWAEVITPPGFTDAVEPLQDKELRYGRVRIIESTPSRVHVRWTYQSVDFNYKSVGDETTEEFYFYPDGFATRVVTLASTRPSDYAFSELLVVLPQAAYPLEVLPTPKIDLIFLGRTKQEVAFPLLRGSYGPMRVEPQGDPDIRLQPEVATGRAYEERRKRVLVDRENAGWTDMIGLVEHAHGQPPVYRIRGHKNDSVRALYFSASIADYSTGFLPFYDQGQIVSPGYWGDHWPLGRGALTGGAISERVHVSPSHFATLGLTEPPALSTGELRTLDAFGQPQNMTVERRAWLIAMTDADDDTVLEWAESYAHPPAIEVKGARLDFPAYSQERRAIRLVAESSSIEIDLKPAKHTVNPVFEIEDAPKALAGVMLDGKALVADAYAWDGATLWLKALIDSRGAEVRLRFR